MCVAIYKPAGVDFPSWSRLKQCWDTNSDGAGFMYADGHDVHIYKGFMRWGDFKKALKAYKSSEDAKAQPFCLHFRIATQGGVNAGMCHPFPLTDSVKRLKKPITTTKIGIVHNGIIPLTTSRQKSNLSDTALFIKDYMTLLIKKPDYWQSPEARNVLTMIDELIGSRMCILSADGHAELIGYCWECVDDVYYSNLHWCSRWDDLLTGWDFGTSSKTTKLKPAPELIGCEYKKTGDWTACYWCQNIECENYSGGYYE